MLHTSAKMLQTCANDTCHSALTVNESAVHVPSGNCVGHAAAPMFSGGIDGKIVGKKVVRECVSAIDGMPVLDTLTVCCVDVDTRLGTLQGVLGVGAEPVPERIERAGPVRLHVHEARHVRVDGLDEPGQVSTLNGAAREIVDTTFPTITKQRNDDASMRMRDCLMRPYE